MEVERTFEYWMEVVARRRTEGGPEALKAPGDDSDLVAVGLTICELLRQIRDELVKWNKDLNGLTGVEEFDAQEGQPGLGGSITEVNNLPKEPG
jgi:hypothetical protein